MHTSFISATHTPTMTRKQQPTRSRQSQPKRKQTIPTPHTISVVSQGSGTSRELTWEIFAAGPRPARQGGPPWYVLDLASLHPISYPKVPVSCLLHPISNTCLALTTPCFPYLNPITCVFFFEGGTHVIEGRKLLRHRLQAWTEGKSASAPGTVIL